MSQRLTRMSRIPVLAALVAHSVLMTASFAATKQNGVTLLSPQGGLTFQVGDSITVAWTLDSGVGITGFMVELSPDAGLEWVFLGRVSTDMEAFGRSTIRFVVDSSGSHPAKPSMGTISLISDSCVLRIRDYQDWSIIDWSSGVFSIKARSADARQDPARQRTSDRVGGRLTHRSHGVTLLPQSGLTTAAALIDVRGRLAAQASGAGPVTLSTWGLNQGAFVIRSTSGGATDAKRLTVGR